MANLTIAQKKENAKIFYTLNPDWSQDEVAKHAGVSRITVNKWINDENWAMLRVSITMMNETGLKNLYSQLIEFQDVINNRPKGERFPTPSEDVVQKSLAEQIKKLRVDLGLDVIVSVFSNFFNFIDTYDMRRKKEIEPLFDAYVKFQLGNRK
jgi:transcriptional regulator with XRE-family HTH domain